MLMKKFLSLFLCLTCVLTLVACGKKVAPITLPQTDEITSIDITFHLWTVLNTFLLSRFRTGNIGDYFTYPSFV